MNEHKQIVKAFCDECVWAWAVYDQYTRLFENGEERHKLFEETASTFFSDLLRIYKEYLFIQICKLTDPAKTMGKPNLTTNYLIEHLPWPRDIKTELESISEKLMKFRNYIIEARHKILSHNDLIATVDRSTLGAFPEGEEKEFWNNLQDFVNNIYSYFFGSIYPIESITEAGVDELIESLKKAIDYDAYFEDKQSEKFHRRTQMKYTDL